LIGRRWTAAVFTVEKSSVEAIEKHKEQYFLTSPWRFSTAPDFQIIVVS
jgi:hypothetical protein